MDRPIDSLSFKGSISEAILEAKKQKKLFVVYVSGEDEESIKMESSTWTDDKVAESVQKYCILLHIPEGSTDAANFSAIYPQTTVPCITVVGYNGIQLSQIEGFVRGEVLASRIEKAWMSLHIQETTATVLTAALASKKAELSSSGTLRIAHDGGESSSNVVMSLPSAVPSSTNPPIEIGSVTVPEMEDKTDCVDLKKEMNAESSRESFAEPGSTRREDSEREPSSSTFDTEMVAPLMSGVNHCVIRSEGGRLLPEKYENVIGHDSGTSKEISGMTSDVSSGDLEDKRVSTVEVKHVDLLDSGVNKPTDVLLNVRLPDGASLKENFPLKSSLSMVKDYIDRNQANGIGSYDLAIPYPRRVFHNQDLNKSLLELGLLNRQAMIVVPHQQGQGHYRGEAGSRIQTNSMADGSPSGNDGGYFAYLRRFLSYANPFSYLGGGAGSPSSSSSSQQESQTSTWQYGPNPSLQNSLQRSGAPTTRQPQNKNTPEASSDERRSKRPSSSSTRFGSNIHTLKHDEDDPRFSDRNAFWNGNSTQFGGDSDSK